VQFNPRSVGQEPYRLREIQVLHFAHERDLVARDVTTEAVVDALFGIDREGRRLLTVKGTQPAPASPRLLECNVFTNEGHDVGGGSNLGDLTVRYSHAQNVPPRP